MKSTWNPPDSNNSSLENYIKATKVEISKITTNKPKQNMNSAERAAINRLHHDNTIVIKPFDKGHGIAIMNTTDYIYESLRQLNNEQYYTKIGGNDTIVTSNSVHELVTEMYNLDLIDYDTYKYTDPFNYTVRTPRWYLLPKVHKPPPEGSIFVGRPIISGCSGPTEKISELIDHFLIPIVKRQHTYIKDTTDFINKIENIQVSDNNVLVTLDVVSMYTNTVHEEAIRATANAMQSNYNHSDSPLKPLPGEYIIKLLEIILKRNTFEFNNEYYTQTCGVSMGSPSSPEIADITFHLLENQILLSGARYIKTWYRFRDDIFMVFNGTIPELHKFIQDANMLHDKYQLTFEYSMTQVTYLDLDLYKGQRFLDLNILDVKTHTKTTETFQYLKRNSCHPTSVFKGFIKGETIRYARTCNNANDFLHKRNLFIEKLRVRDYTNNDIERYSSINEHDNRISHLRESMPYNEGQTIFTTTFNPYIQGYRLKRALLKNWDLIRNDLLLCNIFPNPPLIAFRRNINLKDKLTSSSLRTDKLMKNDTPNDEELLNILTKLYNESNNVEHSES
uniref:Uncharacterized protein LOC102808054 n=1 Tax=Saccoglossus kowalevskii TaxID=10224 RepID=A0ABM0MAH8_SACKO|nr:PREDICTED: uncharacterized protein LOC102808054 [Saccoglossus kowalevskii]